MSSIGKPDRQLWYEFNSPPEEREQFRPEMYLKFLYGHILEDLILFLVEEAGHTVEGEQDEQEIEGIKGHRDAVIDGMLVDVKSASTYSFQKFKDGKLKESDPFGYIPQIQSYLLAGQEDPIIKDKDRAAFLVVDKTLGNLTLDIHQKDEKTDYKKLYQHKKEVIKLPEPPPRCYPTVPDGYKNYKTGEFVANGNEKLGTNCSYCFHKFKCWPGLRTFLSSKGPVYFPVINKLPKMPEITEGTEIKGIENTEETEEAS